MPGQEKMVSTMIAPVIREEIRIPSTVTIGGMAFLKPCLMMTIHYRIPFARTAFM